MTKGGTLESLPPPLPPTYTHIQQADENYETTKVPIEACCFDAMHSRALKN